ncbi:MAG: zinc-ribbon domain-containing protein, partial [bacterium]
MTVCAYCGRENEATAEFCMDCGKPLSKSGALKAAAAAATKPAPPPATPGAPPPHPRAGPPTGPRVSPSAA